MNEAPLRTLSTLRLFLVYTAAFVGGAILLNIVIVALAEFLEITFQNSAMGFILIFVSANYVGQFWYSREASRPASSRAWTVALVCTVITAVLQGLLLWGSYHLALLDGQSPLSALRGEEISILAAVPAGIAVLVLLLIRFGIAMGVKQAAKRKSTKLRKGHS